MFHNPALAVGSQNSCHPAGEKPKFKSTQPNSQTTRDTLYRVCESYKRVHLKYGTGRNALHSGGAGGEIPGFPVLCVAIGGCGDGEAGVGWGYNGAQLRWGNPLLLLPRSDYFWATPYHTVFEIPQVLSSSCLYVCCCCRSTSTSYSLSLCILGILAQSVYGANLILGASSFSPKRLKIEEKYVFR